MGGVVIVCGAWMVGHEQHCIEILFCIYLRILAIVSIWQ